MTDQDKDQIREIAKARIAAMLNRDLDALDQMLDDNFVYTNASGRVFEKQHYIDNFVAPPEVIWHSQTLSEIQIRLHGDTAVLTALTHDRATFFDNVLDASFRTTQVYTRAGDGWKYVAGHTSALPAQDNP